MNINKQLEFDKSIIDGVEIKRCRNTPHAYKPHVHNELSLGYIVEGATDLSLNENMVQYGLGDGVIIPPLMTHRCAPKDIDHWAYIMLYIDPSYYDQSVVFNQARKLEGAEATKLIGFIDQLLVYNEPLLLENTLIDLLLEFGEPVTELCQDGPDEAMSNIRQIHDYILQSTHEELSLEVLQQLFGLNKFTLIRQFKKVYATTPAAYHLQCRVAEAKRMLGSKVDVMDICDALKFYDQAHFIREFKKMHGITPRAYVEQLKHI